MKRLDANMKHIMLLALVALLAAQGGCAQEDGLYPAASITSMQPADGSAGGGVRLVLTGVFQDVHDGDNKVFIGSYPCEVVPHYSSQTVLTCITSAGDYGTYPVTVVSTAPDGTVSTATQCCFNYRSWRTPTLLEVVPQAVAPNTAIQIYGNPTGSMNSDCASGNEVDQCLSAIQLGDYRCTVDLDSIENVYDNVDSKRLGGGLYQLTCTVPAPDSGTGNVFPNLGVAKKLNVTVRFEASMLAGGMPVPQMSSYLPDADGWPYQLQVFPVIERLLTSTGSMLGGTTVQIQGRGFPTLSKNLGDVVSISIAGVPCVPLPASKTAASNFNTIACVTSALPANYTAPVAISGLYPGTRGIEYETYTVSQNAVSYRDLWKLNSTVTVDSVGGSRTVLQDKWEGSLSDYEIPSYCSRARAFFVAPVDGDYTFLLSADDYGQLNGSYIAPNGTQVDTLLAYLDSWTPVNNWYNYPAKQMSAPVTLAKGQPILLTASHCNTASVGLQQVGVIVPSTEPRWASQPEVQQLVLNIDEVYPAVRIQYKWPVGGSTDDAVNITVSTSMPELLAEPRVGVNVVLPNGKNFTFRATANATEVRSAFKTALNATATITMFGVSVFNVSATTRIFQLSARKTLVTPLSSANVSLVLLDALPAAPAPAVPTPITCIYKIPPLSAPMPAAANNTTTPDNTTTPAPSSNITLDAELLASSVNVTLDSVAIGNAPDYASGKWVLVSSAGNSSAMLAYNETADRVKQAIVNITGLSVNSVASGAPFRDGTSMVVQWDVQFVYDVGSNLPSMVAALTGASQPDAVSVAVVPLSVATPRVTGLVTVAMGDWCDEVTISTEDTELAIGAKLASLPSLRGKTPRTVKKEGSYIGGYTITVTFDPVATPGDLPPLRITGGNVTTLPGVYTSVPTVRNGSTNLVYTPIPAELLRLPVPISNTIEVKVNGVPAACGATGPSGCAFTYAQAATPVITSVTPTTLAFNGTDSLQINITGTGFYYGTTVTVGGAPCRTSLVTLTAVRCNVSAANAPSGDAPVPSGVQPVALNVASKGFASGNFSVTVHTLRIDSVTPATVSGTGMTLLNITGRGFVPDCGSNIITVGGAPAAVVDCAASALTIAFYNSTGANGTLDIVAEVRDASGNTADTTTSAAAVTATADSSLVSWVFPNPATDMMPGTGSDIIIQTDSAATAANITALYLVPQVTTDFGTNPTAAAANLSAAMAGRHACGSVSVSPSNATAVNCTMGPVANGWYTVMANTTNGVLLVLPGPALQVGLYITSVSPAIGAIGGSTTVTITGAGFKSGADMDMNVVMIAVPVSTTFLNGMVLCDVKNATTTQITCLTRPHLATDASADDPNAVNVEPKSSFPDVVQVVGCAKGLKDILKFQCWSLPDAARAVAINPSDAMFSYDWSVSPVIASVTPTTVLPGDQFTVSGAVLGLVAEVQLVQNGAVRDLCVITNVDGGSVSCTVPASLPAGVYGVVLKAASGERSVAALGVTPAVGVIATLTGVTAGGAGSIAGWQTLTITAGGAGFNASVPSNNVVTVGGAPCNLTAVTSTTLTCLTNSIAGKVWGEYWRLPVNSWGSFPDLINWFNPDVTQLEGSTWLPWGTGSPAGIPYDWFAARLTFYLQIDKAATYQFFLGADDKAKLYVNEVLLGVSGDTMRVALQPGTHQFVVTFVEYTYQAQMNLQWDAGVAQQQNIPWWRVFPVAPGSPAPIEVVVNGMASRQACAARTETLSAADALIATPEPTSISVPAPQCAHVFSSYMTPSLVTSAAATTTAFGVIKADTLYTVVGKLLGGTDASKYTVTIGGWPCPVANVTEGMDANNVTLQTLTCVPPVLPAATYAVVVSVDGYGAVRPVMANVGPTVPNKAPWLAQTYALSITGWYINGTYVAMSSSTTPLPASAAGGTTWTLAGSGFVPSDGSFWWRKMLIRWQSVQPTGANITATIVSSTFNTMTVRLSHSLHGNDKTTWSTSNYVMNLFVYDARVLTIPANPSTACQNNCTIKANNVQVSWSTEPYPQVISVTPTTVAPTANATLTVAWSRIKLNQATVNNIVLPAVGDPSSAKVYLQSGNGPNADVFECTGAAVTAATKTNLTTALNIYNETVSCQLPDYLPASSSWVVFVCLDPDGCGHGLNVNVTVPINVTSVTPLTGSAAGGVAITLSAPAQGFVPDKAAVKVLLGSGSAAVACAVTAATRDTITCTTGTMAALPTAATTLPIFVVPSRFAAAVDTGFNFTYDPNLTPLVSSIDPARGSTEGGTPVTITGSNFPTGSSVTVTMGNYSCDSATIVSQTTITCTTSSPGKPKPQGYLDVHVSFSGYGSANTTGVQYRYIDLWSRRSTWGGNDPPGIGDSVYINVTDTVMLDISPPPLSLLVIEGNLIFDDSLGAAADLWLQARWILLKSQNATLQIGTADKPFPGKAKITLIGNPDSPEMPGYGSKNIAIREGTMTIHGLPKNPTWTVLQATANQNDTQITVLGPVNWQSGDTIVIASSSYYAWEVDELQIDNVTYNIASNTSTIALKGALLYTHLGVVEPIPGDTLGRVVDMRAEVAVLSRSVVIEGDEDSQYYLFGGQIMVNTPMDRPRANMRLEQVELRYMGQAYHLGRYTLHWHLQGDVAFQSWMIGCVMHHTYNRAATIHGTHHVLTRDCVAYDNMGHAFFLEDGIETGNVYDHNLGILTRRSDALLNTDSTPATFWITNPNNTYRNNRAAGNTFGYGFWYHLDKHSGGPSYSTSVCPKFTPLGEFFNNTAHSNMFYGLRVHPEFLPRMDPCDDNWNNDPDADGPFTQVRATFHSLTSYKNGMKGVVATQIGNVRFVNFTLADNGGGPRSHAGVSGKDNGAGGEITWVVDDRNRAEVALPDMSGYEDTVFMYKTAGGQVGTAGQWPSDRKITGVIMHSPAQFHIKHTALASMVNCLFVGFSADIPNVFAIESCGKCKVYQGGATTSTAGLKFVQNGTLALSEWSWGHQGIFLDTDGTLINSNTVPADLLAAAGYPASGRPNTTWHSAVDSEMFDPAECTYVRNRPASNDGVFCKPHLTFRRVMLHEHQPDNIQFKPLLVTTFGGSYAPGTTPASGYNGTSIVGYSHYNDDGYQFTYPVTRDAYLHWNNSFRIDPESLTYHKVDPLNATGWLTLTTRYIQRKHHFRVNDTLINTTQLPAASAPLGTAYYEKNFTADPWWYGNYTYNSTAFTVMVAGQIRHANYLQVKSFVCADDGCNSLPEEQVDVRGGVLRWSDNATWAGAEPPRAKPAAGDNVTIPYGWNLVIDEDVPLLTTLVIQGNVSFSPNTSITLRATYILVQSRGALWAGKEGAPHPVPLNIHLNGSRDTPDWAVTNDLNLGSKFLVALGGGRIELHGKPVVKRWTRLATAAAPGDTSITLAEPNLGWAVGQKVVITSTSWNPWQAEERTIVAVAADGATLTLDSPLSWPHSAKIVPMPGSTAGDVEMRAEVGLLSASINVAAIDGTVTAGYGGERFGCRVLAYGPSVMRLSDIALNYCGQAGLKRAAVTLDRMTPVNISAYEGLVDPTNGTALSPNPSYIRSISAYDNQDAGVEVVGSGSGWAPPVSGSVFYKSFDRSTVIARKGGAVIRDNLALGTGKDVTGNMFDREMPSTFLIGAASQSVDTIEDAHSNNIVTGNVAAGSERIGFMYFGPPCSNDAADRARYANNWAHSNVVGVWLKSTVESEAAGCTLLNNFTTYMNWDFGIITTNGITTDVELNGVSTADTKFANILILFKGDLTTDGKVTMNNMNFIGQSGPDVCALCVTRNGNGGNNDPGCHQKIARTSYNAFSPFTPAKGLLGSVFAMKFTPGPETYPWDGLKGYALNLGVTRVTNASFNGFYGKAGCDGTMQTHALGNHAKEPEAFHPVFLTNSNVINVARDGLVKLYGPDPEWRNEGDCNLFRWSRSRQQLMIDTAADEDNEIELNCAGPNHVNFRDVDGSITGNPGSIMGHNDGARSIPYEQSNPTPPGPCQNSSIWEGTHCLAGQSTWEMPPALKPTPIPATGIYGDPQHFVLETRDSDSEDRNFSPVMFNVSGVVDLAVNAMDHGCCFAYFCQKRLSTFWTYLPSGQVASVSFTGTPSRYFRLWWPYADPSQSIILKFHMMSLPNRRFTWSPSRGRLSPLSAPPNLTDANGHGAFYWDQDSYTFTIKLYGGQEAVELRTENAVRVSQTLAVSFDAFFDVKEMFLDNLAYVLKIDRSRIQVVKIVPGSTVVDYMLTEDPATAARVLPELSIDTSRNFDAESAALFRNDPTLMNAFLQDVATTSSGGSSNNNSGSPGSNTNTTTGPSNSTTDLVNLVQTLMAVKSIGGLQVLATAVTTSTLANDGTKSAVDDAVTGGTTPTTNPTNPPTTDPTTPTTPSSPPQQKGDDGNSKKNIAGPVAGGVVGGVAGLTLLALVGMYVMKARAGKAGGYSDLKPHKMGRVSPEPSLTGTGAAAAVAAGGSNASGGADAEAGLLQPQRRVTDLTTNVERSRGSGGVVPPVETSRASAVEQSRASIRSRLSLGGSAQVAPEPQHPSSPTPSYQHSPRGASIIEPSGNSMASPLIANAVNVRPTSPLGASAAAPRASNAVLGSSAPPSPLAVLPQAPVPAWITAASASTSAASPSTSHALPDDRRSVPVSNGRTSAGPSPKPTSPATNPSSPLVGAWTGPEPPAPNVATASDAAAKTGNVNREYVPEEDREEDKHSTPVNWGNNPIVSATGAAGRPVLPTSQSGNIRLPGATSGAWKAPKDM